MMQIKPPACPAVFTSGGGPARIGAHDYNGATRAQRPWSNNMQAQATSSRGLWIKLAAVVVIVAAAAFAYVKINTGHAAPDVTFTRLDGQKVALKDLRGKVVMVNFWATSCT